MPHRPPRVVSLPIRPSGPDRPDVSGPLTGLDVVRAHGLKCVIGESGECCCYDWRCGVIVLSPEVAQGSDMGSLISAAEEVAHALQPRWWHRLRFLQPLRWLAEADAFARVKLWVRRARSEPAPPKRSGEGEERGRS